MNKQFLVGNFLPAYTDAYHYPDNFGVPDQESDPVWLEHRFNRRAERFHERKRNYRMRLQLSVALALGLLIVATNVEIRPGAGFAITVAEQERVDLQEITQTVQQTLPPPPPRPSVPIVVPDDEILEETVLDLDASLDLTAAITALPPPPVVPVKEDVQPEPEIFVIVEEMPEMIGGPASLSRALEYPRIAQQAGIEGTVVVKIVVTQEGKPERPEILKSPSEVLDRAAITAVMAQSFKPGRQRGRPVATYMAIPVRFRLTG